MKGKIRLYSVELEHRSGEPFICILAARTRLEAIAKTRRKAQFQWSASSRDFTLTQCIRLDTVDGYKVILQEASA